MTYVPVKSCAAPHALMSDLGYEKCQHCDMILKRTCECDCHDPNWIGTPGCWCECPT